MRQALLWLLLTIAAITEIFALNGLVFAYTLSWWMYLLIHTGISAGLILFCRHARVRTLDLPADLILMIPGMGALIVWGIYSALLFVRRTGRMIENYEDYILYMEDYVQEREIDLHKELNASSAFDHLAQGMEEEKKNVILDMLEEDFEVKVAVLRKALDDKNPEVVHYASSTLTSIEKEYEHAIDRLKNRIREAPDDALARVELIDLYHRYVHTGLAEGALNAYYLQELIQMIDEYLERYGADLPLFTKKMDALIALGEYEKIYPVLREAYPSYPQHWENFFYTIQALFYTGKQSEIPGVIRRVRELQIQVPESAMAMLTFWEQEVQS